MSLTPEQAKEAREMSKDPNEEARLSRQQGQMAELETALRNRVKSLEATELESLRADQSALHAVLQKWCGEPGQEEEGEWISPSEDPDGYDTPGIVDWAFSAWSRVCDRNEKQSEEIAALRAEVERLREDLSVERNMCSSLTDALENRNREVATLRTRIATLEGEMQNKARTAAINGATVLFTNGWKTPEHSSWMHWLDKHYPTTPTTGGEENG